MESMGGRNGIFHIIVPIDLPFYLFCMRDLCVFPLCFEEIFFWLAVFTYIQVQEGWLESCCCVAAVFEKSSPYVALCFKGEVWKTT